MSDEIEELVQNLNSSLSFALKNTLGPFVQKMNSNKQRYAMITSVLKSLPEYQELVVYNNDIECRLHKCNEENSILYKENVSLKVKMVALEKKLNDILEKSSPQSVVEEKINVGLVVIEKQEVVDEDVKNKVTEIYTDAKLVPVNYNLELNKAKLINLHAQA